MKSDFKKLNTCHPDVNLEYIKQISLLYKGGELLEKNAAFFIKKGALETEPLYKERLSLICYENYFSQIVDSITSKLFENDVKISSESDYFENLQEKNDLSSILREICTNNLVFGKSYLMIDFETSEEEMSEYEFEKKNLNVPEFEVLNNGDVINYKLDCNNNFKEVLLKKLEEDDSINCLEPVRFFYKFQLFTMNNGKVLLDEWETTRFKLVQQATKQTWQPSHIPITIGNDLFGVSSNKRLELVSEESKTSILNIDKIPILKLEFMYGLNLGFKLAPIAKTLLQDGSLVRSFYHRCAMPIPMIYNGGFSAKGKINNASGSEDRDQSPLDAYKQKGFILATDSDKIEYLEPKGTFATSFQDVINKSCETMYHLSWQTLSADNRKSIVKSGLSKSLDEKQKDVIISSIATEIKKYLVRIIDTIFGFFAMDIDYEINGLDFSSDNIPRELLIVESTNVSNLPILMNSETFAEEYFTKIADELLSGMTNSDTLNKIKEEIKKSVLDKKAQMKQELDKTKAETDLIGQNSRLKLGE